jgi:membrane protein DedA with SNARE-associated domain
VLIDASVTNSLATLATHVVQHLGYAGVSLMIMVSQVIIVPGTEVVMLFAGFNVDTHHLTLPGIIIAGVIGDVLGGSICYAIAYFGLHEVLERPGSPVHIDQKNIQRAHGWFERYGSVTVAVSRCIPVLRSAPPYAAGIARMPYWRFASMATLGSIVWITGLALIGKAVGHKWEQWKHHLDYVDYAVVVIVVMLVVWIVVRWYRGRQNPPATA